MKKTLTSIAAGAWASAILSTVWTAREGLVDTWTSLDTDGSLQTLSITGSNGFVDGNDVVMGGTLVCLPAGTRSRRG